MSISEESIFVTSEFKIWDSDKHSIVWWYTNTNPVRIGISIGSVSDPYPNRFFLLLQLFHCCFLFWRWGGINCVISNERKQIRFCFYFYFYFRCFGFGYGINPKNYEPIFFFVLVCLFAYCVPVCVCVYVSMPTIIVQDSLPI